MNVKTKALGLVAGSILALSLTTGVMAETTDVTLAENASGSCTAVVTEASASFGTYTWNGTAYVPASGAGSAALNLTVTQTYGPAEVCDIDVSGSDLVSGTNSILVGSISVAHGSGTAQSLSVAQALLMDNVIGAQTANLTLANPGATLPDGTYSGTITFTAAQGS